MLKFSAFAPSAHLGDLQFLLVSGRLHSRSKCPRFFTTAAPHSVMSASISTTPHSVASSRRNMPPHADNPSKGWLIRVSELNPNRFVLSDPLLSGTFKYTHGTIPKHLNLLDYRIAEISKHYYLNVSDVNDCCGCTNSVVKKVIVLEKYVVVCDFAVILVHTDHHLIYWKFGDKAWTPIDTKDYAVTDVVLCNGKCYAIGRKGVLVWFDSKLNLTAVPLPPLLVEHAVIDIYMVEYKSDLYAVSITLEHILSISDTSFKLRVFKKCNDRWKCFRYVILLSSDGVLLGLSTKGNCVYGAHLDYFAFYGFGQEGGVYYMDGGRTSALKLVRDWPPPPPWV